MSYSIKMEKKMNSKKSWFLLIPLIVFVAYFSGHCKQIGEPTTKEAAILQLIYKQSQNYHYNPPIVDDKFSSKAFDEYMENLDPGKRFLTKKDIKTLEPYRELIDDHFKEGNIEFFEKSLKVILDATARSESYYKEFIDQPVSFDKEESLEIDPEKRKWPENESELKDYWRKSIKYELLSRYYDDLKTLENDKKTRSVDSILYDARKDVKEMMDAWYKRMASLQRLDRFEIFANTLIHLYDPHTDYLTPKQKEDFNINMSGKLEGIGARLQTEKEYTKVSSIVPGGPAWKQKELEANDIIMGVQQDKMDMVDIKGMVIDDVVKQIRGKKGTKVTLKVKKSDGNIKEITIVRDEVIMDEGFARSAFIDVDSVLSNVGYIKLPKFYADFDNPNGTSCSRDVAKELKKLKAEGATSVILDLRYNGGGSLQEVVEMSGLFFEQGPVVQVRDRTNTNPYSDNDSSVDFDGPVVVLVNSNSASASEIIAACLQDYKRAVIVGGEPTFGKGSVQRFINFDRIPGNDQFKPLGDMKITIQKYYRVNGGSVQLKGVEPDVILPDIYSEIDNGEKEYEHPMPYDVIDKKEVNQNTYVISNIEEIKAKSKQRIKSDSTFTLITEQAKKLKEMRDQTVYSLNFNTYKSTMDKRKEEAKKFDKIGTSELPDLKSSNIKEDMAYINVDSSRIGRNEDFLKNIRKDLQIYESVRILKDVQKK